GHRATDTITHQQIQQIFRRLYGAPIESKQDVADEHASGGGRTAFGGANDQKRLLFIGGGTLLLRQFDRLTRNPEESPRRVSTLQYLGGGGPGNRGRDSNLEASNRGRSRDANHMAGRVEERSTREAVVHRRRRADDLFDGTAPACTQRPADY